MAVITRQRSDLTRRQWLIRFLTIFVPLALVLILIASRDDGGLALLDESGLVQLGMKLEEMTNNGGEVYKGWKVEPPPPPPVTKKYVLMDGNNNQHIHEVQEGDDTKNWMEKVQKQNEKMKLLQEDEKKKKEQVKNEEKATKKEDRMKKNYYYDKMNVVLFYADDWTMKVLGKLNPHVKTPNIDHMADKGMLFTNNCVTTSICWMSRASLALGVYSARHQQLDPSSDNMFTTHPWTETLWPLMKQVGGYHTGIVGKWHAPQPDAHMKMAFDFRRFYYGSHWMRRGNGYMHVTECNEMDSLEFLRKRPKNKKFFLTTSFFATHAEDGKAPYSYKPTNHSMFNLYQNVTIPTPKTATEDHWKRLPEFFTDRNEGRNRWKLRFEPDYYQENIKNLYRMATEVDTAVGNIIQELKNQGVYNNTLLLFTTDNGNLHGEHGLAEKWYPFEEAIRVPLVIQDPRMPKKKQGLVNEDWTLSVDLTSTILGAAGIESSSFMQGRDIADLYLPGRDPSTWRQDWFYEYNRGDPFTAKNHPGIRWIDASFALVNKEWKYVYWPNHDYEQLFHRSLDPYDEWDTLKNKTVKTTDELYRTMKARYKELKILAQTGKKI